MEPHHVPSAYKQVVDLSKPTLVPAVGASVIVGFTVYVWSGASKRVRVIYSEQLQNVVMFTAVGALFTSLREWSQASSAVQAP